MKNIRRHSGLAGMLVWLLAGAGASAQNTVLVLTQEITPLAAAQAFTFTATIRTVAQEGATSMYEARFEHPLLAQWRAGRRVALEINLPEKARLTARVTSRQGSSLVVRFQAIPHWVEGYQAQFTLKQFWPNVYRLPISSVISSSGDRLYVYVLRAGRVEKEAIDILQLEQDTVLAAGAFSGDRLLILSGQQKLNAGDLAIAVDGQRRGHSSVLKPKGELL